MRTRLTIEEARELGAKKLRIDQGLFDRSVKAARQMQVRPEDMGPMTLALAILGVSKAHKGDSMARELTDALELVARVENEWRMELRHGPLH